jgi:hypothetical protein
LRIERHFTFADLRVAVHDQVSGTGSHDIVSRLHVHPECMVQVEGGNAVTLQRGATRVRAVWEGGELDVLPSESSGSWYAEAAGSLCPNPVIRLRQSGPLPWQSHLVLQVT